MKQLGGPQWAMDVVECLIVLDNYARTKQKFMSSIILNRYYNLLMVSFIMSHWVLLYVLYILDTF